MGNVVADKRRLSQWCARGSTRGWYSVQTGLQFLVKCEEIRRNEDRMASRAAVRAALPRCARRAAPLGCEAASSLRPRTCCARRKPASQTSHDHYAYSVVLPVPSGSGRSRGHCPAGRGTRATCAHCSTQQSSRVRSVYRTTLVLVA